MASESNKKVFLGGVYELDNEEEPSTFNITKAPTISELGDVLNKIIHRTVKHLEKRGLIYRDEEDSLQLNLSEGGRFDAVGGADRTKAFKAGSKCRRQCYCSQACRCAGCKASRRKANRIHALSPEGKLDNRDRSREFRKRKELSKKIAIDTSSAVDPGPLDLSLIKTS